MKKLVISCSLLLLFSCTRAEKEGATAVTLNLPSTWGEGTSELETKSIISSQSFNSGLVPASLSDLNCFAVLVGGPESSMSNNICKYKTSLDPFAIGIAIPGFTNGGASGAQLKFEVPNGKSRSIYLVGFKILESSVVAAGSSLAKTCSNLIKDSSLENYISEPYMISTTSGINMTGEDLAISMTANLNTGLIIGDCKGPLFPSNGGISGGVPYRIGISFQDGVGTSPKVLGPEKCVGVRFQVQDSSGKRANMIDNPTIKARVTMNSGGSAIGTFYNTGGSYACQSGTEMSSGSSDMTFAFKNNGTAFSDFVAFFSPSNVQGPNGSITVIDNGSLDSSGNTTTPMLSSTLSFDYSSTSINPARYAIYDLFNNRSTYSTDASNAMVIKANQCREAYLQFLDANGVPTKLALNSGVFRSVEITPVGTTSNLKFYSSSSDCSISSNDLSTAVIAMPALTNYGGFKFYYKMAIPLSVFSFSALNGSGTSTPAISTGDMDSTSNFWRSESN